MIETRVVTAHLPLALADKVEELAAGLERSKGWVVKEALSEWVAQEEQRRRWTLDAMADVDAGRVIPNEAVKAWADSLDTDAPLPLPKPGPSTEPSRRSRRSPSKLPSKVRKPNER